MNKLAPLLVAVATATEMKQIEFEFMKYIAKHNKNYATVEEYTARLNNYIETDAFINEVNAPNSAYTHTAGHNKFSDWTKAEFENLMREKHSLSDDGATPIQLETVNAGKSVDWRTAGGNGGCVNPVQNQGSCGSCYSFAGTAAAESSYCIDGNGLPKLSEQQGVDCSTSEHNNGCDGGLAFYIWNYMQTSGLELGVEYPYTQAQGTCKYKSSLGKVGCQTLKSYTQVTGGSSGSWASTANMMAAVDIKPNAVSVNASSLAFRTYQSGVLTEGCYTSTNHAIVIVGYSTVTSPNYYIVRNSWGADWGDKGYINIGMASGAGICGINQRVGYPFTKTWSA